jgi:hypothetical protein
MTGPDHYRKAEELAAKADEYLMQEADRTIVVRWAAAAQVHATLALAAATALGKRDLDNRAWADAAGLSTEYPTFAFQEACRSTWAHRGLPERATRPTGYSRRPRSSPCFHNRC